MDLTIIGTGVAVLALTYTFLRNFKIDINKRFDEVDKRFDKVDQRFEKVDFRLNSIDQRLSRLEGSFEERGHWEGKIYTLQSDKNEK